MFELFLFPKVVFYRVSLYAIVHVRPHVLARGGYLLLNLLLQTSKDAESPREATTARKRGNHRQNGQGRGIQVGGSTEKKGMKCYFGTILRDPKIRPLSIHATCILMLSNLSMHFAYNLHARKPKAENCKTMDHLRRYFVRV